MRIVLAGASGLIGTALSRSLAADGHELVTLVRHDPTGPGQYRWDPARAELDPAALPGADAVICLSGAAVAGHRWTERYKRELLSSRLDTTGVLAHKLAGTPGGPRVLLAASAVGYYGDTGELIVDETAPPGQGFLAELCTRWEAAAEPAAHAGVRVARMRTGLVLTGSGGLVAKLRPIVRLGVAGRLGTGQQFMPWISLADEIAAIRFLLDSDISGPVNLTAPNPARNTELIAELARQLHRPAALPTPSFAVRIALGELAQDALTGQRAVPAVLTAAGFTFQHTVLADAVAAALSD